MWFTLALYNTLSQHQSAMQTLSKRNAELKQEISHLANLLDDLARGYNPNYQDMAVKGAVMAHRSWKKDGQETDDAGEEDSGGSVNIAEEPAIRLERLTDEGEWTQSKVQSLVDADVLETMDTVELGAGSPAESGLRESSAEQLGLAKC